MAVNIPQIASVEIAVKLYYEKLSLFNKDITTLFPGTCSEVVCRLKKLAREKAEEKGMTQYNSYSVLTDCAYEAWGLNIDQLERRLKKLRQYEEVK